MQLFGKQPIAVMEMLDDQSSINLKEVLINAGFYVEESFNLMNIHRIKKCAALNRISNLIIYLVFLDYGNPITLIIGQSSKKSFIYLFNENNWITENMLLKLFSKLLNDGK